ncbi:hypothetical protein [Geitlerinema sp. PCC 7407]|uniref:hypothetical protein n=1 Tax=Geitlerinema sp. PCC 7407 TaxID=1173025 RepID=UPI00029F8CAB|nr:hypothetical protein [Geitlerinema sp. PCC 7407]AFY67589.1 hypothetical protein GEI7407_3121 [Geitlerinema sp. PCC 7407]
MNQRISPTVAFTLILLTLMLGSGVVSAAWGFALGRTALQGVRQPDVRPNSKQVAKTRSNNGEAVFLIKETEILKRVKAKIAGQEENKGAQKQSSVERSPVAQAKPVVQPVSYTSTTADTAAANLPRKAEDEGIVMTVASVRQQGETLLMDVSLQNQGDRPIEFLYSFLDVKDDRGQTLIATTEGLPTELAPQSGIYSGVISVPTAVLENSRQISLALTNYPEQQLALKISGIPVVR